MSNPYLITGIPAAEISNAAAPHPLHWNFVQSALAVIACCVLAAVTVLVGESIENAVLRSMKWSGPWTAMPLWLQMLHVAKVTAACGIVTVVFAFDRNSSKFLRTLVAGILAAVFPTLLGYLLYRYPAWFSGPALQVSYLLFGPFATTMLVASSVGWARTLQIQLAKILWTTFLSLCCFGIMTALTSNLFPNLRPSATPMVVIWTLFVCLQLIYLYVAPTTLAAQNENSRVSE